MSKSIIKELIESNVNAFKDSAARAAGRALICSVIANPKLKEQIAIAEGIAGIAALADKNGAPGKVLGPVAVGALSVTIDDIVHELCSIKQQDGWAELNTSTFSEYEKQRELDTVFSSAADGQAVMTLPEEATPEKAKVIALPEGGGVVKPNDGKGLSIGDAIAEALTGKPSASSASSGESTTTTKSSGNSHLCPRCGKASKKGDLKQWKPSKDVLKDIEGDVLPHVGASLCGTCRRDLNQLVDKAHKNVRRMSEILDKVSSNKASTEKFSGELAEYQATLESVKALGDKAPAPMVALATEAEAKITTLTNNIARIEEDTKKLEAEYDSLSGTAAPTEEAGVEKSSEL